METVRAITPEIGGNKVFIERSIDNLHGIAEQLASALYGRGSQQDSRQEK